MVTLDHAPQTEQPSDTTASGLRRFTQYASCEKCLHDDIGATYDKGCGGWRGCTFHPEVIHRNCRRCGFKWDEAPVTPAAL